MEGEGSAVGEREEVEDTITRLFVNTDERNWSGVMECLAPKVLFDVSSLSGTRPWRTSPRRIVEKWESGLKGLTAVHHQIGNVLVKIEGAEASAFCYGTATHYFPNPSGNDTRTFVGTYDLHLVKADDGWRIDAFRFNLKFASGNPLLADLANRTKPKN
jgi:SnoaL-like protein